jgi:hypothetical protein
MSDWGGLVALSASYLRSVDISIDWKYGTTPVTTEHYGLLDPRGRSTLQYLRPGVSVGYAF